MKKKLILIISSLLLIILILILVIMIFNKSRNNKIYLNDKYYKNNGFIEINSKDIDKLISDKESYILFVYNNYCTLPIPCERIFKSVSSDNAFTILKIPFEEFKKALYYKTVKYSPTVIIINKGKVVDYLKSDNDDDLEKYQDKIIFLNWIKKYINI